MASHKALFILTEVNSYKKKAKDNTESDQQTGFYLPEAAHPHHILTHHGYTVFFATANGKPAPVDVGSVERFKDEQSVAFLNKHIQDGLLKDVKAVAEYQPNDFDIVFFPGGHGPMFDLANNEAVGAWVAKFYEDRKGVVGAVCHGPAGLVPIKLRDGKPLVEGKEISCFTNNEEDSAGLVPSMPFLLETRLRQLGARTTAVDLWKPCVVTSERIVTGQNPASGTPVGEALVKAAHNGFHHHAKQ